MGTTDDEQAGANGTGGDAPTSPTPQTAAERKAAERAARDAGKAADDEPRFTRDRVLGSEGETIAGQPAHVIVGALHDTDQASFTRRELADLIDAFLSRPVPTED